MSITLGLGKRLSCIATQICDTHMTKPFDQIWDCCCDHGYLGIAMLKRFSAQTSQRPQINFIDKVPHITKQLQDKLTQESYQNYQVLTLDAGHLELAKNQGHCIVLAGVTSTGMLKLLETLLSKHPQQNLDFILCPTRGQHKLRQYLIKQDMHLIQETYIEENGRHYEVLHVRHQADQSQDAYPYSNKRVSSIGEFWQTANLEHLDYLENRITHYQQEAQDPSRSDALKALQLYSAMIRQIK
ncbi:MAG: tRNA (adenine22-N1)-methyltransferase [Oleiphilaceae bacterium]|jgi:tRNA (adenine22-N1)-methyltransferase